MRFDARKTERYPYQWVEDNQVVQRARGNKRGTLGGIVGQFLIQVVRCDCD